MKRYEELNKILGWNKSPEMQACGAIVEHIKKEYGIDESLGWWQEKYNAYLKWLNEEV